MLGQDLGDRVASGVGQRGELFGDQGAGEGGAAEEAATEPGALLVGEVDQHEIAWRRPFRTRPGTQQPEPGEHAERPVEASPGGHRIEVGADGQGRRTPVGAR